MSKLVNFGSSVAVVLTIMGGLATTASAQVLNTPTTKVQNPFSVKLGAFFNSNGNANTYGGRTELTAGLDYAIAKTTSQNPVIPSVYLDYEGGSHSGGHIDTYGLGVAVRTYTASIAGKISTPYIGAGIGVYDVNGEQAAGGSKTNVSIGGKVFVGEDLGSGFFVEGNYTITPGAAGIDPNGFGLLGGYRF